jgi:hypothetical protein
MLSCFGFGVLRRSQKLTSIQLHCYCFTRALPPRGNRDPRRLAEGGALPYKGARHCPACCPAMLRESDSILSCFGFGVYGVECEV